MRYRRQAIKPPQEGLERRRRKGVAALPALFTLGNCICGFASLQYTAMGRAVSYHAANSPQVGIAATKGTVEFANFGMSHYTAAGYFIFAAMLFDMFDGFVARLARATSDFGAELDSLADMVSFGIAPAFLSLTLIDSMLHGAYSMPGDRNPWEFLGPNASDQMEKLFWIIGAVYVGCTALRLARFNVRNKHEVDSHMNFRGMPSPGAAGVVASSIIFFEGLYSDRHILHYKVPEHLRETLKEVFPYVLPAVLLIAALLMVSRFPYAHLINRFLRGRKKFRQVVVLFLIIMLLLWQPQITALLAIYLYAISAPLGWAFTKAFRPRRPVPPAPTPQ